MILEDIFYGSGIGCGVIKLFFASKKRIKD
jgi:hypothetical protein